jgi:hypothetical protein
MKVFLQRQLPSPSSPPSWWTRPSPTAGESIFDNVAICALVEYIYRFPNDLGSE